MQYKQKIKIKLKSKLANLEEKRNVFLKAKGRSGIGKENNRKQKKRRGDHEVEKNFL